jgi:hypothetical protein
MGPVDFSPTLKVGLDSVSNPNTAQREVQFELPCIVRVFESLKYFQHLDFEMQVMHGFVLCLKELLLAAFPFLKLKTFG